MPSDHFDSSPDYNDMPDFRRLAREIGQEIAASRPPNALAHNGRAFWKLTDADSGALAWLAFTRPDARSPLARRKVWTLIPSLQEFIANWFVSVDHIQHPPRCAPRAFSAPSRIVFCVGTCRSSSLVDST